MWIDLQVTVARRFLRASVTDLGDSIAQVVAHDVSSRHPAKGTLSFQATGIRWSAFGVAELEQAEVGHIDIIVVVEVHVLAVEIG